MSYTITLSIHNHFGDTLTVVEETCWYYANGGTWTERDGQHVLSMAGSGTSGMLRFKSSMGESFALIVGIHNFKPWCDLVVDLKDGDTNMKTHPLYYDGTLPGSFILSFEKTTAAGRTLEIDFTTTAGSNLVASLISTTTTVDGSPNGDGQVLLSEALPPVQVQDASDLPEHLRRRASDFDIIKQILTDIREKNLLTMFHELDMTDLWLPFNEESLPTTFTPGQIRRFQQAQLKYTKTEADLDKGRHCHISSEDIDVRGRPKSLNYIRELGFGGFGSVWQASGRNREVYALKIIGRERKFSETLRMMKYFESELRIMRKITFSDRALHFVKLVGSYMSPNWAGLLITPVADYNLGAFLQKAARSEDVSERRLLWKFFGCLASAFAYLHHLEIRHKDIKPANILVYDRTVYITDFGMSLDWGESGITTTHTELRKSIVYCSPEAARGDPRRSSSDIWSLGCVYLEMITVLKGSSVAKLKKFLKLGDFLADGYWSKEQDIVKWVESLEKMQATCLEDLEFEDKPLEWIKEMLRRNEKQRPTARDLRDKILSIPRAADGSATLSCDICRK